MVEFYYKWAAIAAAETSFNHKKLGKPFFNIWRFCCRIQSKTPYRPYFMRIEHFKNSERTKLKLD